MVSAIGMLDLKVTAGGVKIFISFSSPFVKACISSIVKRGICAPCGAAATSS